MRGRCASTSPQTCEARSPAGGARLGRRLEGVLNQVRRQFAVAAGTRAGVPEQPLVVSREEFRQLSDVACRDPGLVAVTVNLTVTEVCMLVGFSSVGTFSRRFSELVGRSPSAYREEAVRLGGPAPIPGCFALMWRTGRKVRQESAQDPVQGRRASSPAAEGLTAAAGGASGHFDRAERMLANRAPAGADGREWIPAEAIGCLDIHHLPKS